MKLNKTFSIIFFAMSILGSNLHAIEDEHENYARTLSSHIVYTLKQLKSYVWELPSKSANNLQRLHFRLQFQLAKLLSKKDTDPECACFFIQPDNP